MSGRSRPPPADEWEITYRSDEPFEQVTLAFVDFGEIDASWSAGERQGLAARLAWLLPRIDEWDDPEWLQARTPVTLVFECNWGESAGTWRRTLHGVNDGRRRFLAARQSGRRTIWAKVLERLFFPPGERPLDRADVPTCGERRILDPGEHAHVRLMDDTG